MPSLDSWIYDGYIHNGYHRVSPIFGFLYNWWVETVVSDRIASDGVVTGPSSPAVKPCSSCTAGARYRKDVSAPHYSTCVETSVNLGDIALM